MPEVISNVMVVGDKRKHLAAIVTIRYGRDCIGSGYLTSQFRGKISQLDNSEKTTHFGNKSAN